MKQLVWAAEAAADLEHIADYLFESAPERAAVLVHRIYAATQGLPAFPRRGRPGRIEGTREMVLTP